MIQGFGGFFWGLAGAVAVVLAVRGAGPGFRCVLLCLEFMMKIKILNSIKSKRYASLESLSDDDLWQRGFIYCGFDPDS